MGRYSERGVNPCRNSCCETSINCQAIKAPTPLTRAEIGTERWKQRECHLSAEIWRGPTKWLGTPWHHRRAARIRKESDVDWKERFISVMASVVPIIDPLPKGERKHVWKTYFIKDANRVTSKYQAIDWFGWLIATGAKHAPSGRRVFDERCRLSHSLWTFYSP